MSESEEKGVQEPPPSVPPPRGPRLGVLVAVLVFGLVMLVIGAALSRQLQTGVVHLYQAIREAAGSAAPPATAHRHGAGVGAEGKQQYWTCGMHPWVVLPEPGNCPICHMTLVPLDVGKFASVISIDPIITQNIGVRIAPVVSGPLKQEIRTVGLVDYNETAIRDLNLKVGGWIEKLYVDYVGQPVQKDQPLLDIYSPELYATQQEYIQAYKQTRKVAAGDVAAGLADLDRDLLESARKRLEFFDVPAAEIKALQESGKPNKVLTLRSPFRGTVIVKNAFEGMKVEAGTQLFRIADLSKVWVMVTLYEYQLPYIQVGQKAAMTLPYVPGHLFDGKITYIYPFLNQELRQAKVRLEFENPALLLKPGMFANVEIRSTLAEDRTLVPREAVIDTGTRQLAFVSLGDGRFDPRRVRVGVEAEGGMVEILDGLKPGEMVVTSGQFLLDSESRLRESLARLIKGAPAAEQKAVAAVAGGAELASLPDAAAKALAAILDGYLAIGSKLADDSTAGLAEPARQAAEAAGALLAVALPQDPHFWHQHTEVADVRGKALALVSETDLARAREAFADMSIALGKLLHATGVPPAYDKDVQELHCPMYREGQGGNIWLQTGDDVRNPYFGKAMLKCFDRRQSLAVTGAR